MHEDERRRTWIMERRACLWKARNQIAQQIELQQEMAGSGFANHEER